MGCVLYLQFNINNSREEDWTLSGRREAIAWISIEIIAQYLYIFSSMIYLFKISFRGMLGYNDEGKQDRYKYDAIEYYQFDLDWFAFLFIFLFLDVLSLYWSLSGIMYTNLTMSNVNSTALIVLCCTKLLQTLLMSDIRDSHKRVIQYSNWLWLIFAGVYLGIGIQHYIYVSTRVLCNHILVEAAIKMEISIFVLQFLIYFFNKNDGKM